MQSPYSEKISSLFMVDSSLKWLLNHSNQWLSSNYLSYFLNKTFTAKTLFNQHYLKEYKAKESN